MKLSEMKTNSQLIAEESPEFIAEWNRTALGRAVAIQLVAFRSENELSQAELARLVGKQQPAIARLERGESNPSIETLAELSDSLGITFSIDVRPVKPAKVTVSGGHSNKTKAQAKAVRKGAGSHASKKAAVLTAA